MVVAIVSGANVVHLVGGTALHAAGLGLLAGESDPENVVRVGRETGATNILLVTSRINDNGVLWGACTSSVIVSFHLIPLHRIRYILQLD